MSVEWTAQALESLQDIVDYIAQNDRQTAHRFVDTLIADTEATIGNHPHAGRPGRVDGTREWVAHRNYVVAYRVTNFGNVQVLNVVHSARLWPGSF